MLTNVRPWYEAPFCALFYRNTPEDHEALQRDAELAKELGCTVAVHDAGHEMSLAFAGPIEAKRAFGIEKAKQLC